MDASTGRQAPPAWRKSSHSSNYNGCVEVAWRKSSYSANGNCVEVAASGQVLVRDSKNPGGPVLTFSAGEWEAFLGKIRSGGPGRR